MKTITLPEDKVGNLLVYLERLVVYEDGHEQIRTKYIREDVLDIMRSIRDQTGIDPIKESTPTPTNSINAHTVCEHVVSKRGVCQLCGEKIPPKL